MTAITRRAVLAGAGAVAVAGVPGAALAAATNYRASGLVL